ncbi:hypothetical protein OUZ56_030356 [Daphnia magna]|uniref:Uncharacterized protein n=1 Tax=Daphnia magna TaxID=35525 RepID=A0ABQ9ZR24_9CRUS|nr:hypothetical protein OUZ56_030356 [Daphnia magna]
MESQTLVAVVQHQNGTSPRKTPFSKRNQQEHLIRHCFVPLRLCVNHLGNTCFMNGVANTSPIQHFADFLEAISFGQHYAFSPRTLKLQVGRSFPDPSNVTHSL